MSQAVVFCPQKKHRRSRSAVVATTTVTVEDGDVNAQAEITADPSRHQRRNSTPINKKRGMKKYHSDTARKENGEGGWCCVAVPIKSESNI